MEHHSSNSAHGIASVDNHSGIVHIQSEISLSDLDSGTDCILSQAARDSPALGSSIFDNVILNSRDDEQFDDRLVNIAQFLRETASSNSREGSPFSKDRPFLSISEQSYDFGQCSGLLLSAEDLALDGSNDPMMSIGLEPDNLGINENSESEMSQLTQSTDEVYQEAFQIDGEGPNGRTLVRAPSTGSGSSNGRAAGVPCPVCNKSFNNSSALAKHKLTHSDERKHACSVCMKTFKRQDHLNGHMLTHSAKKPFECPVDGCDKSYCDARSLRRHQEYHQEQANKEQEQQIQLQQKSLREYRELQEQQQRQKKELQQQISAAAAASSISAAQGSAQLNQPTDQPLQFRCGLCRRNFKNLPALNGHMRTHGGFIGKKESTVTHEESSSESLRTANHMPKMSAMSLSSTAMAGGPASSTQLTHRSIVQLLNSTGLVQQNTNTASQQLQLAQSIVAQPADSRIASSIGDQQILLGDGGRMLNALGISGDVENDNDKLAQYIQIGNNIIRLEDLRLLDSSLIDSSDAAHSALFDSGNMVTPSDEMDLCLESSQLELLREQQLQQQQQQLRLQQLLQIDKLGSSGNTSGQSIGVQQTNRPQTNLQQTSLQQTNRQQTNLQQTSLQQTNQKILQQTNLQQTNPQQTNLQQTNLQQTNLQQTNLHQTNLQSNLQQANLQQTNQLMSGLDVKPTSYLGRQEVELSGSAKPAALGSALSNTQLQGLQQSQLLQHLNPSMQQLEQLVSSTGQHQTLRDYFNQDALTDQILRQQQQQEQQQQQKLQQQLQAQKTQQQVLQQQTQLVLQKQQQQLQQQQKLMQSQPLPQQQEISERIRSSSGSSQTYPAASTLQNLLLQWRGNAGVPGQKITAPNQSIPTSANSGLSGNNSNRSFPSELAKKEEDMQDILANIPPDGVMGMNSGKYRSNIASSTSNESNSNLPPVLEMFRANKAFDDFDEMQRKRSANANTDFSEGEVPRKRFLTMPPFSGSTVLYNLLQQQQPKLAANLARGSIAATTVSETEVKYSDVLNSWAQGSTDTKPYVAEWTNKNLTDTKPFRNVQSNVRRLSFSDRDSRIKPERPTLLDKSHDILRLDDINLFTEDSAAETPDSEHEEPYPSTSVTAATSDEFRHPRVGPGFLKFKRKNRPEPLIIPTPLRFQSQLRSPRTIDRSAKPTFTPYTPPPMLSPVRSGSGLWCNTFTGFSTPKSAPVSMRLSQLRRNSGALAAETIPEEEEEEEEEVKLEVIEKPPETDVAPHINIGPQYQAELPEFTANHYEALKVPSREDLLWDPTCISRLTKDDLQSYMDFACSACVLYNGGNKEYAMHILNACKGNVKKAVLKLMLQKPEFPAGSPLHSYIYQESDVWSSSEIEAFQSALNKHGKDFCSIAQQIESKNSRECVQQYYIWKKVCADEHKRQRILRRKKEQENLYNLRSSKAMQEDPVIKQEGPFARYELQVDAEPILESQESEDTNDTVEFSSSGLIHVPVVKDNPATVADVGAPKLSSIEFYIDSVDSPQHFDHYATDLQYEVVVRTEEFPCKICGKVFTKVKSRSAHMKSHRQTDGESNRSNSR